MVDYSDKELMEKLNTEISDKEKYQIAEILQKRGYDIEFREEAYEMSLLQRLCLILVGGFFVYLATLNSSQFQLENAASDLILNGIIRVVALFWTLIIASKYRFNKIVFGILALGFGGWTLIGLGIFSELIKDMIEEWS